MSQSVDVRGWREKPRSNGREGIKLPTAPRVFVMVRTMTHTHLQWALVSPAELHAGNTCKANKPGRWSVGEKLAMERATADSQA